jgi:hypothetical protein
MFIVRWKKSAQDELAHLWLQADSAQRQAITAASHTIDQLLKSQPHTRGESRSKGRRILFVPPLGLTFRINDQKATVFVLHVWSIHH